MQSVRHPNLSKRPTKKRKPRSGPPPQFRLRDLSALFTGRYAGELLPDDDSGREDFAIAAHHLARLAQPDRWIRSWASLRAPWMANGELDGVIAQVLERPIRWKADTLARKLNVTAAERAARHITTIGAIDETREQREAARKERNRARKEAKRRAAGAKPRAQFESQGKPWVALGIARSTWYKHRKREP